MVSKWPWDRLGITSDATPEQVRHAYHILAKRCHPDQFTEPEQQRVAQETMIELNRAYEEALKLATSHASAPYRMEVSCEDAIAIARKMFKNQSPESALHQLMRAATKNAAWYNMQGIILMAMEQYDSAHQSFREAIRRDPQNNEYRRGALDAAVALRKSKTLAGKLHKLFRPLVKKRK